MATNATTWFYREPETGRPYLIGERVTHTFWANRLSNIYFKCVHAESPYRVVGEWEDGITLEIEWEVNKWFILTADRAQKEIIAVCAEVLGFPPSLSFTNDEDRHVTEWYVDKEAGQARKNLVQGTPGYRNVNTKYGR